MVAENGILGLVEREGLDECHALPRHTLDC